MVHPGMVGITELMTDDSFLAFMETMDESAIATMSVYEIYAAYMEKQDDLH